MEIIENFYQILYTKEKECTNFQNRLLKNITIKPTEEQMAELDKAIDKKSSLNPWKASLMVKSQVWMDSPKNSWNFFRKTLEKLIL